MANTAVAKKTAAKKAVATKSGKKVTPRKLQKPNLAEDARAFAEDASARAPARARSELAPVGQKSGLVPEGDVRLTANINAELHVKMKMLAAMKRITVGELVEQGIMKAYGDDLSRLFH